ncbi:MAG: hypothetical protein JSV00_04000 [bacterium]|nr:MAG: hypothetical protein JSV00_04000 [bacterium]
MTGDRIPAPAAGTAGGRAALVVALVLVPVTLFLARDVVFPVRFLVWHASSLAWMMVVLFSSWGQGAVVLGVLKPPDGPGDPLPGIITELGVGLGIYSLETFLLGTLGFMGRIPVTVLVLAVTGISLLTLRRRLDRLRADLALAGEAAQGAGMPLALAALAALVSFPFALVPTRAFDAMAYHLEIPLRYLQAGRVLDIPENVYSYAPQLVHMLYGLAMGLSGSDLAGLLNHLFFVLALCVLWLGFRERFGSLGGAWAAALAALPPLLILEVPNGGVDWAAAFYTLATLALVAVGLHDWRRAVTAGILAGMAAGCRHQPLGYAIVLPAAAGILDRLLSRRPLDARRWALFLGTAVLVASPWYVRNWLLTGDPVFPLLSGLAGKTDLGAGFVTGLVGPRPVQLLWQWIVLPVRMVFDPLSYSMTATVGVHFLVLVPLLFLRSRRPAGSRLLLFWLLLSFAAWYLTFRTARYAMPVLSVFCLWLGAGLADALSRPSALSRALKYMVLSVLILNTGVFVGLQDTVNRSVGAALGLKSSQRYLMESYGVYPALEYLNGLQDKGIKVLFVGEMRGFYSAFPREVPSHNAPNRLLEMVKEGRSAPSMAQALRQAGFTHILYNPGELERVAYGNRMAPGWKLTPEQRESFSLFLANETRQVFRQGDAFVFEVLP